MKARLDEDYISMLKVIEDIKDNGLKISEDYFIIDLEKVRESNSEVYDLLTLSPDKSISILREVLRSFESVFNITGKKREISFLNFEVKKNISKIRVDDLGKLVTITGNIKRATNVISRVVSIDFECAQCGTTINFPQTRKKISSPYICSCANRTRFTPIKNHTRDVQELNVEEFIEEIDGKAPKQIRVYLEGELVNKMIQYKLQPGKKIAITGVVKTLPPFMTDKDMELNLSEFMLYANELIPFEVDDLTMTEEDIKRIKEIASNSPLQQLSNSLAPEVFGNEEVKEAIVLQLVKGVTKKKQDGSLTREDIHILLAGDPGVAKSVMLTATSKRSPRARMVVGTKTSRVGLGAMAVKDELSGSWSLEAGALVLCSGSILMLDEIDKMNKEHINDLLEPMSGGTVSVNKAGISAVLPARTSILASANPIQGTFSLLEPLAKQIDLSSPILNRFDLVFVMLDKINTKRDSETIEHVFNSYINVQEDNEIKAQIDIMLFKKYIQYCRELKPKLTKELVEHFKDFYNSIRGISKTDSVKGLPINMRNIEGIIRLAEANAKIRLSDKVELEDFEVAKKIFMFCLNQIGFDSESGIFDMSRQTQKVPVSKRNKVEVLLNIISRICSEQPFAPYRDVITTAQSSGIQSYEVSDFLDQLKREGKIFEPKQGVFQLL